MTDAPADLTQRLLDAARRAGAEAADAIAVRGTSLSIDVKGGTLEHAERSETVEIGLRLLIGRRQACVSASDTGDDTIREMAERGVAMARVAPEDPTVGLANAAQLSQRRDAEGLDLCDPSEEPSPDTLLDLAARAEAAALSMDGISKIDQASGGYSRRDLHLAATNGFAGGYGRTDTALSCVAITGSGTRMERDWCSEQRVFAADLPAPEEIGHLAGQRAIDRRDGRKPPTGHFPVLFDERVAATLIGHLLSAIDGRAIARGASWARDLLGRAVLPDGIDLHEDPHRPRIGASRLFDAEGLPTRARDIVTDGILNGWTLDLSTARKLGLESTANAARGPSAPPSPSIGSVRLTPGDRSRDDLIRDMGRGLVVTSLIGSSINPTTGDYSRGASGFWVENGVRTHAVTECTVAGHLPAMLRSILPANDAQAHKSRVVPSLLVGGMTIAGA